MNSRTRFFRRNSNIDSQAGYRILNGIRGPVSGNPPHLGSSIVGSIYLNIESAGALTALNIERLTSDLVRN